MNVVENLVLQVLFISQALKNVLLGCYTNAARCKWGKVAVMVWVGGGSNFRGWGGLMQWSSQRYNTNQGRVGPNWSVNMPVLHDKGFKENIHKIFWDASSFQYGMQLLLWGEI